jgi:hypothetical protein
VAPLLSWLGADAVGSDPAEPGRPPSPGPMRASRRLITAAVAGSGGPADGRSPGTGGAASPARLAESLAVSSRGRRLDAPVLQDLVGGEAELCGRRGEVDGGRRGGRRRRAGLGWVREEAARGAGLGGSGTEDE